MSFYSTIIGEIKRKRLEQDHIWGGPDADDRLRPAEWMDRILHQAEKLYLGQELKGPISIQDWDRSRMLNIAALAVAALQSMGRKAGLTPSTLCETLVDPFNATAAELLGSLQETSAAFLQVTPTLNGIPQCSFIVVRDGPVLQPTLDILEAICSEDSQASIREKVLAALDRLDAPSEAAHV